MRKNGYTKMCIQFDLEYRFMKFRYPHAVGTLQHILKKMKIQIGDENTLQCSEHRNIFDYKIRITGPQNYDEMYPDKLDETLNCNVLDKSSQGRSITIDVGGKEFVSNTAVFRRYKSSCYYLKILLT